MAGYITAIHTGDVLLVIGLDPKTGRVMMIPVAEPYPDLKSRS